MRSNCIAFVRVVSLAFLCSLYPVHCLCKRIILERKSKLWYFLFPGIYDKRSNSTQYRDECIYGIRICFIDTGFHTSTKTKARVCFSMLSHATNELIERIRRFKSVSSSTDIFNNYFRWKLHRNFSNSRNHCSRTIFQQQVPYTVSNNIHGILSMYCLCILCHRWHSMLQKYMQNRIVKEFERKRRKGVRPTQKITSYWS